MWRKSAMNETPMQSDQIVALAQAVRLLAWHVEVLKKDGDAEVLAEIKAVRMSMVELMETIKVPFGRAERFGDED